MEHLSKPLKIQEKQTTTNDRSIAFRKDKQANLEANEKTGNPRKSMANLGKQKEIYEHQE